MKGKSKMKYNSKNDFLHCHISVQLIQCTEMVGKRKRQPSCSQVQLEPDLEKMTDDLMRLLISKKRLRYEANKTKEQISRNPIILEAIFRHLDPGDVLRVALVCRTWNDVVEQPRSEWGTLIGRD